MRQNFLGINFDEHWSHFKFSYNKNYNDQKEESYRRSIFVENVKKIIKHNIEADLGLHSYVLGVNEFADLTTKEFSQFYNGFSYNQKQNSSLLYEPTIAELPDEVDWRNKGLVTRVKNQKQCGSCWAFSAVASIEGQHAKATGKLVSLSEQQLVDCSKKYGNHGCNGGLMDKAFKYVIANGGIDTEDSYPYKAVDGRCRFKRETIGAKIKKYVDIKRGDEIALQHAVAKIGPISVAIDA
ncbi:cathepsin L1-like protein, partial [Leptotrombidium deliense]